MTALTSARPVGLTRIIVGIAALIRGIVAWDILTRFRTPLTVQMPVVDWLPSPSSFAALAIVAVWIAAAAAFTFGWHTMVSGPALAAAIAAYLFLDHQTYSNHLYLMLLLVILLFVANSGAALSIEHSNRQVATWPITLIKVQISIVYLFTAITKLNSDFLTGRVLAGTARDGVVDLPEFIRTPRLLAIMAVAVVATELYLAIFLWRPAFRPAAIVLGFGLHVAIPLLLTPFAELAVFSLLMFATYPLFLDSAPLRVIWDDDCDSCRTWIALFRRVDSLGLIESVRKHDPTNPIPHSDIERSMHTVSHTGQRSSFAAVTEVLERLVPTLWVAPILRLPGARHLGERWYRWQAARRTCRVK